MWWHSGIIYQIYPRSFQDTDGDGVGDLRGITQRLDHLQWLGVDAVWISPVYPSPMADFGYDIRDYTNIDPLFGSLEHFDALVAGAHSRGLRVIMDFVPNHTSDQHPWFVESRASRSNPKRDWYIWRNPSLGGGPPNNWISEFGGTAWEYDAHTGQYYYHAYLKEQPDLNWRNPQVQDAMHDVLRFWLKRGVDGFRVDVLWRLIKDDQFRNNPPNPYFKPGIAPPDEVLQVYSGDRPEVHDVVAGMRRVLAEYGEDRILIGELYLPIQKLVNYYGHKLGGAHIPLNFQLIFTRWDARAIENLIEQYEAAIPEGGWPNWVLGNHDQPRIASRVGLAQARVAAMLLLTVRGTPTLYYGDEIGMQNVSIPPERVQDPFERRVPGQGFGRDPERTPMQWSAGPNAGFTTGTPWLPIDADASVVNVEVEHKEPDSMLTLYHALIALRRASPALALGSYQPIAANGSVLAYIRAHDGARFLVALNLSDEPAALAFGGSGLKGRIRLSTHLDRVDELLAGDLPLRDDEGVVVQLDP